MRALPKRFESALSIGCWLLHFIPAPRRAFPMSFNSASSKRLQIQYDSVGSNRAADDLLLMVCVQVLEIVAVAGRLDLDNTSLLSSSAKRVDR
jgi:hypothetical protein